MAFDIAHVSHYLIHFSYLFIVLDTLELGKYVDIGAFTYINARYGVEIEDNVQIGSHCSIYSHSTIDNKK
ncbi:MAG: hypothetical protein J7J89_05705, partial [Thermoplasmata archaeon]|nr:hypothetical protein [Thermoplasmata archaeon]